MTRPEREPFDPVKVSPSRLNSYVSCGVAFRMNYIDRLPPERSGSAALFGNVVHAALEKWAINREADLLTLMRGAWLSTTEGTIVNDFVGAYAGMAPEVIRAKHICRQQFEKRTGNPSKLIERSGEWKRHPTKKKVDRFIAKWLPKLEDAPWRFSEFDPLPSLYEESLQLAKRYEARYKTVLPNALYTEFSFDVKWGSFLLNGYIDAIEPVLSDGELVALRVVDYKTYRAEAPEAKDWRQGVFYDVALRDLIKRGAIALPGVDDAGELTVPLHVVFDYPRLLNRKKYVMTETDSTQLMVELQMYRDGVEAKVFLPADKGRNPDFCDYPSNCCLRNRGGCAMPEEVDE